VNVDFRVWLPDEALHGGAVKRTLREIARRWSERWFARQLVGLCEHSHRFGDRQPSAESEAAALVHDDGMIVTISAAGRSTLAGLILDIATGEMKLNPADRFVLDGLADDCIRNLCSDMALAFGLKAETGWRQLDTAQMPDREDQIYHLGTGAPESLIEVRIAPSVAVALIKASGPPAPNPSELLDLGLALARQQVRVSAYLGRCRLTLGELSELAPGDVVVLDRDLGQPLPLAVEGKVTSSACTAERENSKFRLKIIKPLCE